MLNTCVDKMDLSGFLPFLREKCAIRNVDFKGPDDFFQETILTSVGKTWKQWLGPLVPDLPPFELVIDNLRQRVCDLFK